MMSDAKPDASSAPGPPTRQHKSEASAPGQFSPLTDSLGRSAARLLIAVAVSAALCLLIGRSVKPNFGGPTDIVGYPTFASFNYAAQFWYYRLTVYVFPLLAIFGYFLLARIGPLRSNCPRPARRTIELVEAVPRATPAPHRYVWSSLLRMLPPATVVVAACSARTGRIDLTAVAGGVVYVALVGSVALLWARRASGQQWRALSTVNGVSGAVAAILGLWYVSAHTVVQTSAGPRSWPWMVWWLPVVGATATAWWAVRQVRSGRAARDVELTLLTVVVGAIALFLAVSLLPGEVTLFQGFDDATEMAGASLAARGYFPWRDVLFVHGVFPDVLTGSMGQAIFGDSIWGVFAVHTVVLVPLFWVSTYLFAVWASRRNPWFLVLAFLWATSFVRPLLEAERVSRPSWELLWSERFIGLPVALIVLGETVRRRSAAWAVGLTLLLFAEEILVPETIFVAGPALVCVVAADLLHRRPGQSLWAHMRLTRWCVGAGLAAAAAWAIFLVVVRALGGFVDYYVVFGPGHNLAGAIPPTGISPTELTMLAVDIGCVMLTVWVVAIKVRRRADWDAREWVAVAAAAFVALYLEKALGRFDTVHVWQVFGASLPLVVLCAWRAINSIERRLVDSWRPDRRPRLIRIAQTATITLIPALLIGFVLAGPLRKSEGQHYLSGVSEAAFGRLGYSSPGAVDVGLLRDLATSIRTYAGDGPVFDMTNSPGYMYFLLDRVPGTRFVHVSMAISQYAQRLLIADLKASRPPVVIYDADSIGMPAWDGITNNVRHYEVSEYVLHDWTPVLRTHGVLVMVRNDLVAATPLPALTAPAQTTNLYFSGPSCHWGATPNYLRIPESDGNTTLPVRSSGRQIALLHYSGWAVDPDNNRPARVILVADGDQVVGTVTPSIDRPDVAEHLHQPSSASGFEYNASLDPTARPSAYFVGADGAAHHLAGSPATPVTALRLPDGSQVMVAPTVGGNLEVNTVDVYSVNEVELPTGINLRSYDLATLSSAGELADSKVALTDQPSREYHEISANWLERTGPRMTLRVGSCPQWYGYDPSTPLFVLQSGGAPVTSVTLSVMRD